MMFFEATDHKYHLCNFRSWFSYVPSNTTNKKHIKINEKILQETWCLWGTIGGTAFGVVSGRLSVSCWSLRRRCEGREAVVLGVGDGVLGGGGVNTAAFDVALPGSSASSATGRLKHTHKIINNNAKVAITYSTSVAVKGHAWYILSNGDPQIICCGLHIFTSGPPYIYMGASIWLCEGGGGHLSYRRPYIHYRGPHTMMLGHPVNFVGGP